MPTHNVNLTDHQSAFIRECLDKGRYKNASEVVRTALRLLEREEEIYQEKLARLRALVQEGLDDVAAGRYIEINSEEDMNALFADIGRECDEQLKREANEQKTAAK